MAIDIIARGLATSLLGSDGKISSEKMPSIGAIRDTSGFIPIGNLTDPSLVEGKTAEEILLMMLFGIVNPTFTDPNLTIELSTTETVIVGKATTISGTMIFDRGAITPPYGTSGYRSGTAIGYEVNGVPTESADFTLEIIPIAGDNLITCKVFYAAGEQPLNSIGQNYDNPLPAGSITAIARVTGVNQLYANEYETLDFTWFKDEDGEGYQSVLLTETATTKQSFAVAKNVTVIGIKQFEVMTQTWQWIGGSAEASLTYFDTIIIEGDSLGKEDDYILYTNNDFLTGERELRIYVE